MIYEVYLNDNLLYYPNEDSYAVLNAKLETALNEAGSFECDVPKTNIRYTDFDNGAQLRSGIISVLKDGEEIFCGEVRESTKNFDFTYHIYAVGELAYLFDSIQPQKKYQGTIEAMFTSMLSYHNSQVENRKKFTKGNVLVTDGNNYVYHFTNREDTLTDLREKLCNTLDGYLRIRKVNGTKYLDLVPLANYGSYCQQEIQFGVNMLDYSENYTANDIATCVIPLGVRFEENQRTAAAVEGLDEYLTIKGTAVDSYHTNTNYDYVYIPSAVNRFGWVRVVKHWDDVTVAENLKTKAERWLSDAQYAKMQLQLSAVDLALIDNDIESFEIGDTVHCWAEVYGMDTTFPVQKKTIYLNDLSKNTIVLSNTRTEKSFTSQQSNIVNQLKEEIPQISPLLEESRAVALAMLLDETQGGHVVYEYHYNNGVATYIEAINICDGATIAASTKRWRWSRNGLGYMYRSSAGTETSPAWNGPTVAMTSDGKINASMITTGTLNCDRLNGGTINGQAISGGTISGASISGGSIVSQNGAARLSIQNGALTATSLIQAGTLATVNNGAIQASGALIAGSTVSAGTSISAGTTISAGSSIGAKGSITTTTGQIRTASGAINTGNGNIFTGSGSIFTSGGDIYTTNGNITTYSGTISAADGYNSKGYVGKDAEFTVRNSDGTSRTLKFKGGILTAY